MCVTASNVVRNSLCELSSISTATLPLVPNPNSHDTWIKNRGIPQLSDRLGFRICMSDLGNYRAAHRVFQNFLCFRQSGISAMDWSCRRWIGSRPPVTRVR